MNLRKSLLIEILIILIVSKIDRNETANKIIAKELFCSKVFS